MANRYIQKDTCESPVGRRERQVRADHCFHTIESTGRSDSTTLRLVRIVFYGATQSTLESSRPEHCPAWCAVGCTRQMYALDVHIRCLHPMSTRMANVPGTMTSACKHTNCSPAMIGDLINILSSCDPPVVIVTLTGSAVASEPALRSRRQTLFLRTSCRHVCILPCALCRSAHCKAEFFDLTSCHRLCSS